MDLLEQRIHTLFNPDTAVCACVWACVCERVCQEKMRMETPTLTTSRPSPVAVWMLLIMAAAKRDKMSIDIRALLHSPVYRYERTTSGYLYWECYGIKNKRGLARNDVNFLDLSLISWSPRSPNTPNQDNRNFYTQTTDQHFLFTFFSVLSSLILINKPHETSTYHRVWSWKRPLEWCN